MNVLHQKLPKDDDDGMIEVSSRLMQIITMISY